MVPGMAKRLRRTQLENPVQFTFDGEPYVGSDGDSLAVALWAAGLRSLTRSPKYHRPRGPFCFTGQCEGCLVRVQGTPNTMACRVRLSEGLEASAQNYLGSPRFDLLRAADWMFPSGLNHHEFMAGVPVAEDVMKAMARRIAGLGILPDGAPPAKPARREEVAVLVVGGGIAGSAVAQELPGATVVDLASEAAGRIALGVFGAAHGATEVLVVGPDETVLYAPRALVLAPGAHEGLPVFENNDLPGIVSLRGALALALRSVDAGHAPLVVELPGGTGLGRGFATERGYRHVRGAKITAASGGSAVERVVIDGTRYETDALVIDGPRSPSFELAVQAGANAEPAAFGFRVRVDENGRAAEGVWACGEATGIAFGVGQAAADTRAAIVAQARRVAAGVGRGA